MLNNRMSPFWQRLGLFAGGVLLLFIPALVVFLGISEAEKVSTVSRKLEAEEKNRFALGLLGNRELGVFQLETTVQQFAERVASETDVLRQSHSTQESLARAGLRQLAQLKVDGISPEAFLLSAFQKDSPEPLGAILPAFCAGVDGEKAEALRQTLVFLTRGAYLSEGLQEVLRLNELFQKIPGANLTLENMLAENRSKLTPIVWDNRAAFLFWQPLFTPDYSRKIAQAKLSDRDRRLVRGFYSVPARKEFLQGGILLIINREHSKTATPESLIAGLQGQSAAAIGFFPAGPGKAVVNQEATEQELQALSRVDDQTANDMGWVVTVEEVELDQPYSMVVASRIGTQAQALVARHFRIRLVTIVCLLVGMLVWFLSVYCNIGVTSFLSAQMLAGFGLAALLPLSSTFLVSELLVEEYREDCLLSERMNLLREMAMVENRGNIHHYWFYEMIKKASRLPVLRRALDACAGLGENHPARRRLQKIGAKVLRPINSFPVGASIRNFSVVSAEESLLRLPPRIEGVGAEGKFTIVMGNFGRHIITALNPNIGKEPRDGSEDIAKVKQGMLWDFGIEYLQSLFGPETYYNMLFAPNEPCLMILGNGNWGLMNVLLPATGDPLFTVTWIFLSKYSDQNALARILSVQNAPSKLVVFRTDQLGTPMIPEWGERYPFLRQIARQVMISESRVSSRIQDGNETWFVEGSPFLYSRQFLVVGMVPLSRVNALVTDMRGKLQLVLLGFIGLVILLSAVASRDILLPVRQLTRGMSFVQNGDFRYRLPIDRSDELGEVSRAFNIMARGLEEGKLMEKMLSFSARDAAGSETGMQQARQGTRKWVTVVYIGIPGFNQALSRDDPQDLFRRLNEQVKGICRCVVEHGGDVDKLMGDKVLAYFDHTQIDRQAIGQALLNMLQQIRRLQSQGGLPFPVAIGINTGEIIAGLLGAGDCLDFTIIGDPVNLAARCQALAEGLDEHRVIVTDLAAELLAQRVDMQPLSVTAVKGKQESVRLSQVILSDKG